VRSTLAWPSSIKRAGVGAAPSRSRPRLLVLRAVFFKRNCAKLQDNHDVFNEYLRENAAVTPKKIILMKPHSTNTPETREPIKNRQIFLSSRPSGEPSQDNFRLGETEIPKPGPGQMLLRTIYLSVDPYMRSRMNAGPSYAPRLEIGEVMVGQSVCQVVESNVSNYSPGDIVLGATGWQEFSLSNGEKTRKIDRSLGSISYALGVLGMPGFTAYAGLLNIGKPQPGETIVVAAASGAVGSVVGQIAKIKGCRVVGIAGGEQNCRFVKDELGFDACLDHREPELGENLKAACPEGIDIYFENVGDPVFDAVLPLSNNFARIPVCGLITQYNAAELPPEPDHLPLLMETILLKRLTIRGFIYFDYASQFPDFVTAMEAWLAEGRIKYREDITDGLENAPRELIRLLKGENFGKKIIRVSPDPTAA
jgi:NADPH-dependent curcumin reductase CurA